MIDLKNISKLAKLDLIDSDSRLTQDLEEVIDFNIAKLDEVDVTDVAPSYQVEVESNVLGEDMPRPSLSEAEIFLNTSSTKNHSFKVKAILE